MTRAEGYFKLIDVYVKYIHHEKVYLNFTLIANLHLLLK